MPKPKRSIDDILHFRDDISPFLIHMTKKNGEKSAKDNLHLILKSKLLKAGKNPVSAATYARSSTRHPNNWMFKADFDKLSEDIKTCFRAICFSETPLRFSHCLFDIAGRSVNLEPYGIVLIKSHLQQKGVSPVLYINNYTKDKEPTLDLIADLVYTNIDIARELIPLLGFAGHYMNSSTPGIHDFQWEREWRYPAIKSDLKLSNSDIFIGLCPSDDIEEFEKLYPGILFIDPMFPLEYFATKLISCRKKHDMKYSIL